MSDFICGAVFGAILICFIGSIVDDYSSFDDRKKKENLEIQLLEKQLKEKEKCDET